MCRAWCASARTSSAQASTGRDSGRQCSNALAAHAVVSSVVPAGPDALSQRHRADSLVIAFMAAAGTPYCCSTASSLSWCEGVLLKTGSTSRCARASAASRPALAVWYALCAATASCSLLVWSELVLAPVPANLLAVSASNLATSASEGSLTLHSAHPPAIAAATSQVTRHASSSAALLPPPPGAGGGPLVLARTPLAAFASALPPLLLLPAPLDAAVVSVRPPPTPTPHLSIATALWARMFRVWVSWLANMVPSSMPGIRVSHEPCCCMEACSTFCQYTAATYPPAMEG
mmetsp:Transcript_31563/g.80508  ORF Transcript_31563/g.80508 Transcript_31563/m.80508 type:complete len:290 (+) Transcript_31563:96-965(+)